MMKTNLIDAYKTIIGTEALISSETQYNLIRDKLIYFFFVHLFILLFIKCYRITLKK